MSHQHCSDWDYETMLSDSSPPEPVCQGLVQLTVCHTGMQETAQQSITPETWGCLKVHPIQTIKHCLWQCDKVLNICLLSQSSKQQKSEKKNHIQLTECLIINIIITIKVAVRHQSWLLLPAKDLYYRTGRILNVWTQQVKWNFKIEMWNMH